MKLVTSKGYSPICPIHWCRGHVPIHVVSRTVKRQLLMHGFGILDTHIVSSRDLIFLKGSKCATNGDGATLSELSVI